MTCSLWPWRTQVFWGEVLQSHMRIPKDGDPRGPGQGAGGGARILTGVGNTLGPGLGGPRPLCSSIPPHGIAGDCKNANPVKGERDPARVIQRNAFE